jgi:hypothetical protein
MKCYLIKEEWIPTLIFYESREEVNRETKEIGLQAAEKLEMADLKKLEKGDDGLCIIF